MNDKITVKTNKGIFVAYAFENDGYTGIRTEFISNDDKGQNPGRPAVSLETTPDGELQTLIYDTHSEDPVDDYIF